MLKFVGHDAAVVSAAKGGFQDVPGSHLQCLQSAFAVLAGLPKATDVRIGDVLDITSRVFDALVSGGLMKRPASVMLDSLRSSLILNDRNPPDAPTFFLNSMISAITCMRIRSEDCAELVNWKDGIETGFAEKVRQMYDASFDPTNS
jgi:hypothetical protein